MSINKIFSSNEYIEWLTNLLNKIGPDTCISSSNIDENYNDLNEDDICYIEALQLFWNILCNYSKKAYIPKGYIDNSIEWFVVKYNDTTFVISKVGIAQKFDYKCYLTDNEELLNSTEVIDYNLILNSQYSENSKNKIKLMERQNEEFKHFIEEAKTLGITKAQLFCFIEDLKNLINFYN